MTQGQQTTPKEKNTATLKRNALTVECFFNENGRLEQKIEWYDKQFTEYAYQYDAKGHLTKVRRGGLVAESYQYNHLGQRVEHTREYRGFSDSSSGTLRYDGTGRLIRAGDTTFQYNAHGALAERHDNRGITKYFYGKDTMPDKVVLPSGQEICYKYDKANPLGPAQRFRNKTLTAEFVWADPLRLAMYKDYDNLLEYTFTYDTAGVVSKVRIEAFKPAQPKTERGTDWVAASADWLGGFAAKNRHERLHDFLGKRTLPLELLCGCDQVGTLKILTDKSGKLVKEIVRDSFGIQLTDTFPELFMPIGFAGGLADPDTGLVRFGYRDYDPSVGRFTALDPLGDTGGDHDLYDYCIDDPVTMNDPSGLFPPLLLFLGAKALVLGLTAAKVYGSAWVVDRMISAQRGKRSTDAVDAMNVIAPKVAAATALSTLPVLAATAPGIATAVGQRAGAAIQLSKHGDRIIKTAPQVKDFIEGAVITGPPAMTVGGAVGNLAEKVYDEANKKK